MTGGRRNPDWARQAAAQDMTRLRDLERDALALVQACLDEDQLALVTVLDHCDQRGTCSVLADILAHLMAGVYPDPGGVLDRMRQICGAGPGLG